MQERVLALEGVHNFRDAGGYAVASGGRIKRGLLWRSGQHHSASDADLEVIAGLGLTSVFDLRSSGERSSHPCRRPVPFTALIFESGDPDVNHAPHISAAKPRRERTVESTRDGLLRNYGRMAFRLELQAMIRQYFDQLAFGQGASVINCMAGKDRTGVAVALLHAALGVHRDDIMADYLLTNTAGDSAARIAAGQQTIRGMTGDLPDEILLILMSVEPAYLEGLWAAIEAEYGHVDTYLESALGLDHAKREQLLNALIEG